MSNAAAWFWRLTLVGSVVGFYILKNTPDFNGGPLGLLFVAACIALISNAIEGNYR